MSNVTQQSVEITIADHAEEALALNEFYRQRTLGVQAMRRTSAQEAAKLKEELAAAKEALDVSQNALTQAVAELERVTGAEWKPVEQVEDVTDNG